MSAPRPVWLEEEAEVLALLHEVLNRFDRLPADARQRNVVIPVESHMNSLARADPQADQSWELVRELERLGLLSIRKARGNPYDPDWKGAKLAFAPASDTVLRDWLDRARTEPALQQWQRAVEARASDFYAGCGPLLARRVTVAGRSPEEIVNAFASLAAVETPATLRQLSALAFWGDSKVLDARGDLVAALFPRLPLRERPIVGAVHLPDPCEGVLFVENQDTYAAAVEGFPAAARSLALVYAAGFRGAAARIRIHGNALLHYAGTGAAAHRLAFEQWWFEAGEPPGPLWFWGDLDFAGMQILKSLRARFAGLRAWPPGYEPMLENLRERGGHVSRAPNEGGQMDPLTTGCTYADEVLLPAVRLQGDLHQEYMSPGIG